MRSRRTERIGKTSKQLLTGQAHARWLFTTPAPPLSARFLIARVLASKPVAGEQHGPMATEPDISLNCCLTIRGATRQDLRWPDHGSAFTFVS